MGGFDWASAELEDPMANTSNSEIPRSGRRILPVKITGETPVALSGMRILRVEIRGETPVSLVSAWFIAHCCSHCGDDGVINPSPAKLFEFGIGEIKL